MPKELLTNHRESPFTSFSPFTEWRSLALRIRLERSLSLIAPVCEHWYVALEGHRNHHEIDKETDAEGVLVIHEDNFLGAPGRRYVSVPHTHTHVSAPAVGERNAIHLRPQNDSREGGGSDFGAGRKS